MAPPGEIRIGISGWRYRPWRGVFYPAGLPQKDELAFAASRFNTLEINGTFYALQRPESFAAWAAATPPGFLFAVKGPRFITHMLKLRNARTALANFLASAGCCAWATGSARSCGSFPPASASIRSGPRPGLPSSRGTRRLRPAWPGSMTPRALLAAPSANPARCARFAMRWKCVIPASSGRTS